MQQAALELFERESRKGTRTKISTVPSNGQDKPNGVDKKASRSDEDEEAADFVEALAYSRDKFVVMLGTMTDLPSNGKVNINAMGHFWKPWFFKHVEKFIAGGVGQSSSLIQMPRSRAPYRLRP